MIYPNDPEGLFTSISAFITAYIGYYFSLMMADNKGNRTKFISQWLLLIMFLVLMTLPATLLMPINKKLWSISFVFITGALAGLCLTFLLFAVDIATEFNATYKKII